MRHRLDLQVGPVAFRIGSDWPQPIAALRRLYRDYPAPGEGRLAGAGLAGENERLAILLGAGGVKEKILLLAERHLQVHAHLRREQAMIERHRHRVGQNEVALDRHRRPDPPTPGLFGLEADGEVARAVGLGIG